MSQDLYSKEDIKSAISEDPDRAKAMLEANKALRPPFFTDRIWSVLVLVLGAFLTLMTSNCSQQKQFQAELIEQAVAVHPIDTIRELSFLHDVGLLDRYPDVVPLAKHAYLSVAVLASETSLQRAQSERNRVWPDEGLQIYARGDHFALVKEFATFAEASDYANIENAAAAGDPGYYARVVSAWCVTLGAQKTHYTCEKPQ